jgi:hypothetical protein
MKAILAICSATMLFAAAFNTHADIIAGPITNPANGHDYYLLSPNTWTASEAEAESLDGTLAVIKNADEQKWVFSTFAAYDGTNRNLWIGLRRNFPGGPLVWVTGEKIDYSNWEPGQPDNNGGNESYVHLFGNVGNKVPGVWNDLADINSCDGAPNCGVVELRGKANKLSISKEEHALIGNWYEGGNIEQPCWIAGTDKILFVISNNKFAARASLSAAGTLFVRDFQSGWPMFDGRVPMEGSGLDYRSMPPRAYAQMGISGEIIKDKILWSNGTWWSRKPEHDAKEKSSDTVSISVSTDTEK